MAKEKEEVLPVLIYCKKELLQTAYAIKKRGFKLGPALALTLGRYIEHFKSPDEAASAMIGLYSDWEPGHTASPEPELVLEHPVPLPEALNGHGN